MDYIARHQFQDGSSVTLDRASWGDYTHVVYTTGRNGYTYAIHQFKTESEARKGFAAKIEDRRHA
jgi:hypothetical protein